MVTGLTLEVKEQTAKTRKFAFLPEECLLEENVS